MWANEDNEREKWNEERINGKNVHWKLAEKAVEIKVCMHKAKQEMKVDIEL